MNPILVEILRAEHVEAIHRGAVAVVDAGGRLVFGLGDVEAPVYLRSAAKPLQSLPLLASGAAARLGLGPPEIALACGSHGGEPDHVVGVATMLARADRDESALECGSHWPLDEAAARDLAARGALPTPLHNNCSGKHAGFICLAVGRGRDPRGYAAADHPVMREVTAALAAVLGVGLDESNRGLDGCSIPTHAVPLRAIATGFARFGTGELPPELAAAAAGIRTAMAACPRAIAGTGRLDTIIGLACRGEALTKCGAEGVAVGMIPAAGLGIAVKIDDGAGRAVETVMARLLHSLLGDRFASNPVIAAAFDPQMGRVLCNWQGTPVGRIQPVLTMPTHIAGGQR